MTNVSTSTLNKKLPIDYDHLKRYVGEDVQLLREVLSIFRQQTSIWINEFKPHADDQDWYDTSHALKGAAYGIGAWEIGDICIRAEELDLANCNGDMDELVAKRAVLVEELLQSFSVLLAELDNYLSDRVLT